MYHKHTTSINHYTTWEDLLQQAGYRRNTKIGAIGKAFIAAQKSKKCPLWLKKQMDVFFTNLRKTTRNEKQNARHSA